MNLKSDERGVCEQEQQWCFLQAGFRCFSCFGLLCLVVWLCCFGGSLVSWLGPSFYVPCCWCVCFQWYIAFVSGCQECDFVQSLFHLMCLCFVFRSLVMLSSAMQCGCSVPIWLFLSGFRLVINDIGRSNKNISYDGKLMKIS